MDWFIATLIIAVAGVMVLRRSTYLVDYALFVFVLNRGLRRFLDWTSGSFQQLSPISLTPLVVFGLMLFPFLPNYHRLPPRLKLIFNCLFLALGWAFVIGFFRVQMAAVYALAEAIAPVAVFGYVLTAPATPEIKDRWLRSAAWTAVVAAAYGWYQYLTIPPWDAFWVTSVGFVGYLGELEPTKMSVFSTMAERGPFGAYLGFAVVPMVLSPRWRTFLGWFAVVLVASAITLSMARTGIIIAVLSILIFVMVNRGAGLSQTIGVFLIAALVLTFGLAHIPGADRLQERFQTLSNIRQDGSYQGRMDIYRSGANEILTNPLGNGLGATGISGRVNTGTLAGQAVIGDAGFLEIPATYGWIGTFAIVYAIWIMWSEMAGRYRAGLRNTELLLGRAFLIALIPACFVGNVITQFSILWIVFALALRLVPVPLRPPSPM